MLVCEEVVGCVSLGQGVDCGGGRYVCGFDKGCVGGLEVVCVRVPHSGLRTSLCVPTLTSIHVHCSTVAYFTLGGGVLNL